MLLAKISAGHYNKNTSTAKPGKYMAVISVEHFRQGGVEKPGDAVDWVE